MADNSGGFGVFKITDAVAPSETLPLEYSRLEIACELKVKQTLQYW
jgi:hypothetical protein